MLNEDYRERLQALSDEKAKGSGGRGSPGNLEKLLIG
jgi:hypothetical protein